MRRTRIKLCGMTRAEDIDRAIALGADAIGLVFAAASRRRLTPEQGARLRRRIPPFADAVALLMDTPVDAVAAIIASVRPTLLQFHGDESDAECARYGLPFLKAVPMGGGGDASAFMARYPSASGFVFDSHTAGGGGGSGQRFDWSRLPAVLERPWLLAGGLTPGNVADAVARLHPYAVDVASGIERAPGIKDPDAMQRFVAEVRRADDASD